MSRRCVPAHALAVSLYPQARPIFVISSQIFVLLQHMLHRPHKTTSATRLVFLMTKAMSGPVKLKSIIVSFRKPLSAATHAPQVSARSN